MLISYDDNHCNMSASLEIMKVYTFVYIGEDLHRELMYKLATLVEGDPKAPFQ